MEIRGKQSLQSHQLTVLWRNGFSLKVGKKTGDFKILFLEQKKNGFSEIVMSNY